MELTPELVLAQWAGGMAAVAFVVMLWRVTSPGYAWVVNGCAAALALLAWAAGAQETVFLAVLAGLAGAGVLVGMITKSRTAELVLAGAAAATAVAAVTVLGADAADTIGTGIAVVRSLAAAAFLGAVTDAMILGHWYLIDPKLPKTAIRRLNVIAAVTLAVETVAVLVPPESIVAAFSNGGALYAAAWIAVSVFCGVLLLLVSRALRVEGYASVMSATGLLYVATMVAFGVVVVAAVGAST